MFNEAKETEYLDYYKLKSKAIEYLRHIGGNKWNYYEENDPGITILENLLFAIMDLDYRIHFPIEDLLAVDPKHMGPEKPFFMPEEILPSSPITLNDYYKLILDVKGVRNCRVIPRTTGVGGLYDILLHIEPQEPKYTRQVIEAVRNKLNSNRNLCEDFNSIKSFNIVDIYLDISLEPNIELLKTPDAYDNLGAQILVDVQEFFIPKIKFKSLGEMLKIKPLDKIYDGPILTHGFIDDDDLEKNSLKTSFSLIDIIDQINSNDNIWRVFNFDFVNTTTGKKYTNVLEIEYNQVVRVNFSKSKVVLVHNNERLMTTPVVIANTAKHRYSVSNINNVIEEEQVDYYRGEYRNLKDYLSIQNDFPLIYGVGEEGISEDATQEQKDNILMFKQYLSIFDQVLSIYTTRLENIKNLLAIDYDFKYVSRYSIPRTIPDLYKLLKKPTEEHEDDIFFDIQKKYFKIDINYNNKGFFNSINGYVNSLCYWLGGDRRKKVIDHLLSRFSEIINMDCDLTDIDATKQNLIFNYSELSTNRAKAIDITQDHEQELTEATFVKKLCICFGIRNDRVTTIHKYIDGKFFMWHSLGQQSPKTIIKKSQQMNDEFVFHGNFKNIFYLVLLYGNEQHNYTIHKRHNNSKNNDYIVKLWVNDTKTKFINLEATTFRQIDYETAKGIVAKTTDKIKQINIDSEGVYLVEHILLRTTTGRYCENDYSFKMTIVFPDWPYRFQKENFKKTLVTWIADNSPAHVVVDILWLDVKQMEVFESMYLYWLKTRHDNSITLQEKEHISDELMGILKKFNEDKQHGDEDYIQ